MKIRTHRASRQASSKKWNTGAKEETRWFHITHVTLFIFNVK